MIYIFNHFLEYGYLQKEEHAQKVKQKPQSGYMNIMGSGILSAMGTQTQAAKKTKSAYWEYIC